MKTFLKLFFASLSITFVFITNEFVKSEEKITIVPLIKTSKGLSGKNISYPRWQKAELRLFKVYIPVGLQTPIHQHPAPMVVYVNQGKLKHVRGEVVNYFKEGDSFVEADYGKEHFVESIGKKTAILFVGVSSVKGLPITINK